MLQIFAGRCRHRHRAALVQGDGCALPFADAVFDAVLLVQIFGGLQDWRRLVDEGRRVLRGHGGLVLGRTVTPDAGVDTRMRQHLLTLLGTKHERQNAREDAERYLTSIASAASHLVGAIWRAERSPRAFLIDMLPRAVFPAAAGGPGGRVARARRVGPDPVRRSRRDVPGGAPVRDAPV